MNKDKPTPIEFLVEKESELISAIGKTTWEEDKVYFVFEVIKFLEEYVTTMKQESEEEIV